MNKFLIFTDRRGRRWVCGSALKFLFGICEPCKRSFWDYDYWRRRFRRYENY